MTKQAAVDRLVKYLEALGYTALSKIDLELVVSAVETFRGSKAAARYVCAVLGGRGNCLAPLASIDVRRTTSSRGPATRIPDPEEIELQARFLSLRPRPITKTLDRLPRPPRVPRPAIPTEERSAPKTADPPEEPRRRKPTEAARPDKASGLASHLSAEEQSVLRDELVSATLLQQTEMRLAELRTELKSAAGDRRKALLLDEKRLTRNLQEGLAQRKRIASELAQLAKARGLSPDAFLSRFRPSPCVPAPKPAAAPRTSEKPAMAEAKALAKRADTVAEQLVKTETKLQDVLVVARDKKKKRSVRQRAEKQAERLNEKAADLYRERMDVDRRLSESAQAAGTTADQVVESHQARKEERQAREAKKKGAELEQARIRTMERAQAIVTEAEAKSPATEEAKGPAAPSHAAQSDGTKLVNELAANLLAKSRIKG